MRGTTEHCYSKCCDIFGMMYPNADRTCKTVWKKEFYFSCVFEGLEHVTTNESVNIDLLELFIMNNC